MIFGVGTKGSMSAGIAAREALERARAQLGQAEPKLAIAFASADYDDPGEVPRALAEALGDVPIVGGAPTAALIGPEGHPSRGVSVVLLGGEDLRVATSSADALSPDHISVVPAAQEIAREADEARQAGLSSVSCLVFAPGGVDGEALVAAVRKGAGAHAELAGGLTAQRVAALARPTVFTRGEARADEVVLAGLFTRTPVGIAARHGFRPVGPLRTITRADAQLLIELDDRPALEAWLDDARAAGAAPPADPLALAAYLADHYALGLTDPTGQGRGELVARAPWAIHPGGTVRLSGSIGNGGQVQVMHAARHDLLRAATSAASEAVLRAGHRVSGALVLACAGRRGALGDAFGEEIALIRERVAAPIGGACVVGEIAKNARDVDAFFNSTVVVAAFPA